MPLKNWCSIHARCSKGILKHSIRFSGIFLNLKQNFIAYYSSKVSDCIFEIHQLWQSGFYRVYSISCSVCSFEPEILKIGQSSHKMYSNNILNFQVSTTILNVCTKMVRKLIEGTTYQSGSERDRVNGVWIFFSTMSQFRQLSVKPRWITLLLYF